MSRNEADLKAMAKKASQVLKDHPTLKVPEAMRVAKFTLEESKDRTLQMRVRRLMDKTPTSITVSQSPSQTNASSLTSTSTMTGPKSKTIRLTSVAAGQKRVNDHAVMMLKKAAHKKATQIYNSEPKKPQGLSAKKVSQLVLGKFGVEIKPRTIQREIQEGRVGVSPKKMGPQGYLPSKTFDHLTTAFESYIKIMQLNGHGGTLSNNKLMIILKKCTSPSITCDIRGLLRRLQKAAAESIVVGKGKNAEDRRIKWTTYYNLKTWFDSWQEDLIELGFAHYDEENKVVIPSDKLARILNVDETCLVLDGSKCNRGGRPEVIFYSPYLPNLGKATIKNSAATTMIAGSTAAGEPIPPHFQFQTRAQSVDTQSVNINLVTFLPNVIGKFGAEEEKEWAVTFGYNAKGGMDNEHFKEYFRTNIAPLYPDAEDKLGKRVMVKVDSGPGRLEIDFLAEARTSGFIIYPSVPNTTAVTQETDQSYGPFKSKFAQNLKALSDARIAGDFPTSFPPWLVGLLVFGGTDPISLFVVESAFEFGFSREKNLNAWSKCGAAPLTRCCLENHSQVRREMGDDNDATNQMMQEIQTANDISTHFLTAHGYNGDVLKAMVKKVKRVAVTAKHSEERINMIGEMTNHGPM